MLYRKIFKWNEDFLKSKINNFWKNIKVIYHLNYIINVWSPCLHLNRVFPNLHFFIVLSLPKYKYSGPAN